MYRLAVLLLIDFGLSCLALFVAVLLRFEFVVPPLFFSDFAEKCLVFSASHILLNLLVKSYKSSWGYKGIAGILRLGVSESLFLGVFFTLKYLGIYEYSGSILLMYSILVFVLFSFVRYSINARDYLVQYLHAIGNRNGKEILLLIADKDAAYTMIRGLVERKEPYNIIGIINSNAENKDAYVVDVKILGDMSSFEPVVKKFNVTEVIVDLKSISQGELRQISSFCGMANIKVKIFQSMLDIEDFNNGRRYVSFRNLSAEDLIGRTEIKLDKQCIYGLIKDKRVLVTGAAGSIGSEICRQVLDFGCKRLLLLDIDENGLFHLTSSLNKSHPLSSFRPIVASIQDGKRINSIFRECCPDVVFHAAAHKHVPMMEENPCEAIKNNIFGTLNIMNACDEEKVRRLIVISSDKAVNPANVMGATKRAVELLVQTVGKNAYTEMAAVRFGNVIGSNGSVIPIFQKQIAEGGPVTVTHKDIERYFMTIPEAVQLVLQAGALATQGEIFVFDMGKQIRIYDLARDLIEASGLRPDIDIEIKITGLRPGEKLFEELRLDLENMDTTFHDKIFVCHPVDIDIKEFERDINEIHTLSEQNDETNAVKLLFKIVPSNYRTPFVRIVEQNDIPDAIDLEEEADSGAKLLKSEVVGMRLKLKEDMLLREIADQWIVVPIGENVISVGGIITLNETGAFLWKKIDEGCDTRSELVKAIQQEYDIDAETADSDASEFIEKLQQKGLVM